jgi:rRNA maturation RNase YbeY
MITIRNTQRKISIDTEKLRSNAQKILDALNYQDYDLGIWLTGKATIRKYNRDYRHKDKATDILSFPYHPTLKAGERIKPQAPEDKNLGDLILCPEYVHNDLDRWGESFEERMKVLLVHGICHLLGYDHIEDEDYKVMKRKETALLKKIS